MPPKPKAIKGEKAKDLLKEYMVTQNRPFNAATIVSNLHNQVGKTEAVKILDSLVEEGVLQSKDYKSLRYYWANQGTHVTFYFFFAF